MKKNQWNTKEDIDEPEDVMLNDIGQSQTDKYFMIQLILDI